MKDKVKNHIQVKSHGLEYEFIESYLDIPIIAFAEKSNNLTLKDASDRPKPFLKILIRV